MENVPLYSRADESRLALIAHEVAGVFPKADPEFVVVTLQDLMKNRSGSDREWLKSLFVHPVLKNFDLSVLTVSELLLQAEKHNWNWKKAQDDKGYRFSIELFSQKHIEQSMQSIAKLQESGLSLDSQYVLDNIQRPVTFRFIPLYLCTRENNETYVTLIERRFNFGREPNLHPHIERESIAVTDKSKPLPYLFHSGLSFTSAAIRDRIVFEEPFK